MSLGIIIIFLSLILLIANLVEFNIDSPISLYSPVKGTTKPILIFSSEKLFSTLKNKVKKIKRIN